MKDRTPEMEVAADLRKLRRLGITEVEFQPEKGGVRMRAKVQAGRAHRRLTTGKHPDQAAALRELLTEAEKVAGPRKHKRRRKVEARPVDRPGAPPVIEDSRTLAERMHELPPARLAARNRAARDRAAQRPSSGGR